MTRTMADHSRAYRQRKADRIARMEAALREIAEMPGIGLGGDADGMQLIARQALANDTKS